jgi:CDP-glucose 4,6-dehydratase
MLDCSKAWAKLQWKPLWNFKDAIQKTAAWYKHSFENPKHISDFTIQQILEYVALSEKLA